MATVISRDVVLGPDEPESACHPRIIYENLFREGTVTDSSGATGEFHADNATLDPATWNFWKPGAPETALTVELETARPADAFFCAAHTLGTLQAVIEGQYHDGTNWVTLFETLRGDDNVFAVLFDEVFSNRYRILVDGTEFPSIGVVQLGRAMVLPRGIVVDHAPIGLSARTVIEPNISEGGQWLGRSIQREGVGTNISFESLPTAFVRDEFEPFIVHARRRPFGWVWAPLHEPAEVAYCWTLSDIVPQHADERDYMNVSFEVDGLME